MIRNKSAPYESRYFAFASWATQSLPVVAQRSLTYLPADNIPKFYILRLDKGYKYTL